MITRYLKPISITSTTFSDFINAIVSAFVDVGFTEVTPTYNSSAKAVQFGNFEIDIYQSSSVCAFQGYLHYNGESYCSFTTAAPSISGATPYSCTLCFFVSDDEKFIAVNVAAKTEQLCKGQFNFFNIITDNEEICGLTKKTANSIATEFRSANQYSVSLQPKRTYNKGENVFFLDEGMPSINTNNDGFVMDLPYLVTLGGAERSYTYTMSNGDNYYCLIDNIAVKFDTTVFPQTTSGE